MGPEVPPTGLTLPGSALSVSAISPSTVAFVPGKVLSAEVLALSPRALIARLLLRLVGDSGVIRDRKEDLGRLIGLPGSSFNRELKHFFAEGIIESG